MESSNRDRNEGRCWRRSIREICRGPEEIRRQVEAKWPADSPISPQALRHRAAPSIEAAGSLQNELQLDLISGCPEAIERLRSVVPISRGGTMCHPGADEEWQSALDASIKERSIHLEGLRRFVQQISRDH